VPQSVMAVISEDDLKRIDHLLDNHDFPIYADFTPIEEFCEQLRKNWVKEQRGECSFCQSPSLHYNGELEYRACESCFAEIRDKEIDPVNPNGHSLSEVIRDWFCYWIDHEYHEVVQMEVYFEEYGITHNVCAICQKTIELEKDECLAISDNEKAVAHCTCVQSHGFNFSEDEYNSIIENHLLEYLR